jgi:hypothetical protein
LPQALTCMAIKFLLALLGPRGDGTMLKLSLKVANNMRPPIATDSPIFRLLIIFNFYALWVARRPAHCLLLLSMFISFCCLRPCANCDIVPAIPLLASVNEEDISIYPHHALAQLTAILGSYGARIPRCLLAFVLATSYCEWHLSLSDYLRYLADDYRIGLVVGFAIKLLC